ncbi:MULTISPECIES: hypothetical protein [unclassified Pantoea]|uniref:hypothetical protein n=1 Tax=unclassified Pantoea TaxID=2630326 RepID=UPI00226ABB88|nr:MULTISPECIES: hypothetical protein [unclassified Pantoea]
MNTIPFSDVLIFLSVCAFLISIPLQLVGYIIFRRHARDYDALISEFRKRNLQLDILTQTSSFLGSSFHPLKISWFARLYKGVRMNSSRHQPVSRETYRFIQSLPEDENWLAGPPSSFKYADGCLNDGRWDGFCYLAPFLLIICA